MFERVLTDFGKMNVLPFDILGVPVPVYASKPAFI